MAKKIQINNLRISFRTGNGTVKAVRDISLTLNQGETLAIVGESGSGKSVTARAVMGILAPNSIVEEGEILYDGKDLLKITEEEFHHYRGNRLSMIFQDPMSSLNPIMRIGRQLTEAMILNGRQNQKAAEEEFKRKIGQLQTAAKEASDKAETKEIDSLFADFRKYMVQAGKLEYEYETAYAYAKEAYDAITEADREFRQPDREETEVLLRELSDALKKVYHPCVIEKNNPEYQAKLSAYRKAVSSLRKPEDAPSVLPAMRDLQAILRGALERKAPDFFHINKQLDGEFRNRLLETVQVALQYSDRKSGKLSPEPDYAKQAEEMLLDLWKLQKERAYRVTKSMAKNHAIELMKEVGITQARKRYRQYPFQFSGGMRQRIVIAIALAANPDVLICDEPTTALDVTIQSQVLELIDRLKKERSLSVIFITHDLGVVAKIADRVAVMYAGKIVEYGTVDDIFYEPAHPYTWALLSSMPDLDTKEKLETIPGTPPNMIHPPVGDAFAARNKYALEIDFEQQPPMFEISETHCAATWLLHPNAPKADPPKVMTERIARMRKMEMGTNE